jgi:hypothetical protein
MGAAVGALRRAQQVGRAPAGAGKLAEPLAAAIEKANRL